MKRLFFSIAVLIVFMPFSVNAEMTNKAVTILDRIHDIGSQSSQINPLYLWADEAEGMINNALELGTGRTWYVDSGATGGISGTSWESACRTLDAAINKTMANRGDQIRVAQGHAETISAADGWDADVAGITIIHEGNGSNQGTYTFTATASTVAVGAANVTIIGGRLLAGISEVVVGLSVEAAADYLTVIGMEFPEPTTSTFEFNIAVQLTTGSDDVSFIGCTAFSADAVGADHWLNGGAGAVNRLSLIGNKIHGQYAIAPIFSDQADLETYIRYNDITQLTANQFGIEYTGAATGIVADNRVNATVLFEVDPGSMAYYNNMEGDTLPEGVSLNGQLGAFTGPAVGAAQDDNVKASLDLAHTDLDAILADTVVIGTPGDTDLATDVNNIAVNVDAILADTVVIGTPGDTDLATDVNNIAVNVDAILANTSSTSGIDYWQERTITQTDPNNCDSADLFDVAGGDILITSFVIVVTEAIDANATTLQVIIDRDDGAADTEFSTAVNVETDVLGTTYVFSNANPAVLTPLTPGASGSSILMSPWFCHEGMIESVFSAANLDGTVKYYMTYKPLETGVTVTAQ